MTDHAILARLNQLLTELQAIHDELAGGPEQEADDDLISEKAADLQAAAADLNIAVSGDGFVGEYAAARLLRRAPFTLRNWRYGPQPLAFRKLGGRIEYEIRELAAYLARAGGLDE